MTKNRYKAAKDGDLFDYDGKTYDRPRDQIRLNAQTQRVFDLMKDGSWRTLDRIAMLTGDPEASVSARLRDLRKSRFGGHTVDRQFVERGLYKYRLTINKGN